MNEGRACELGPETIRVRSPMLDDRPGGLWCIRSALFFYD